MSRETNEGLYVPYKKEDEELRGYAKFAAEHGAPPLKNLMLTALITAGSALALTVILLLTGLRLTSNESADGKISNYFGWVGANGAPTFGFFSLSGGESATVAGGSAVYSDGSVYTGAMRDLVRHGQGKLIFPDGTTYIGQFESGVYSGLGKLLYPDGTNYEGEFKNGKFHGFGTIIYADGGKYEGAFEDGEFHGNGVMTYRDGSKYEGLFERGMRSTGKYTWSTGESVEGKFVNNLPNPNKHINYTDADGDTYYVIIRDGLITNIIPYNPDKEPDNGVDGGADEGSGDGEVVG